MFIYMCSGMLCVGVGTVMQDLCTIYIASFLGLPHFFTFFAAVYYCQRKAVVATSSKVGGPAVHLAISMPRERINVLVLVPDALVPRLLR